MRSAPPTPAKWPRPNRALRESLSFADRMELAFQAAAILRAQGAASVWLFGSLAQGRAQDWRSDLDLAVEGLPPERYLGALGKLLMQLPLSVDLVEMERAAPVLREQILRTRIPLDAD